MSPKVHIDAHRVAQFCRAHHIRKLAFFGSVLRNDFRPDSDIDVLVWFEPGQTPGMMQLVGLELELTEILGRQADLHTPEDLSRLFRDEVISEAEVQYAA